MVEVGLKPRLLSLSCRVAELKVGRPSCPLYLRLSECSKKTVVLKNTYLDLFGSVLLFVTLSYRGG